MSKSVYEMVTERIINELEQALCVRIVVSER